MRLLPDFHFFEAVDARAAAAAVVFAGVVAVAVISAVGGSAFAAGGGRIIQLKITLIVVAGHVVPAFRGVLGKGKGGGLPIKGIIPTSAGRLFPARRNISGCGKAEKRVRDEIRSHPFLLKNQIQKLTSRYRWRHCWNLRRCSNPRPRLRRPRCSNRCHRRPQTHAGRPSDILRSYPTATCPSSGTLRR